MQPPFALAFLAVAGPAAAHDGHGLDALAHWHPTDAWGFVALALAAAAALWWRGRK